MYIVGISPKCISPTVLCSLIKFLKFYEIHCSSIAPVANLIKICHMYVTYKCISGSRDEVVRALTFHQCGPLGCWFDCDWLDLVSPITCSRVIKITIMITIVMIMTMMTMLTTTMMMMMTRNHALCFYWVIETWVRVWVNEKCRGNTSRRRVFPQLFRVLPNFHECFYRRLHLSVNTLAQNHVFSWRQTSEFQVSNVQVFPPNCEVLLLDTAQREDDSNQQGGKKSSERCPPFNDLRN